MAKRIFGELGEFARALQLGRPENIRRIVIDIQVGHVPIIHVEEYGTTHLLDVVRELDGVRIERQVIDDPGAPIPFHGPVPS